MASKPTSADVAVRAGVSRTTVSNAYNRPDQLSPDRRRLVLEAAAELGYAGPDPLARSLRTGSADVVGLLFSAQLSRAFSDPAAVEFLEGVAEVCEQRGRSLLLIPAGPDAANIATVRRAAADGFVVYSMPARDPQVEAVLARPEPVVIVDSPLDVAGADFVGIDDRRAFAAVAEHVVGLGHRDIGLVTVHRGESVVRALSHWQRGEPDPSGVFAGRLQGLIDVVADRCRVEVFAGDENTSPVGRAGTAALLQRPRPPTAIMCTSDALAFGALAELAERGIAVPDSITVTGFDDVQMAAQAGLTTVAQPAREKGRRAGELLLDAAGRFEHCVLSTTLVVRGSSAAPARLCAGPGR